MRLRKPCEHGRYDEHVIWNGEPGKPVCPGGEFLADDALIIEKEVSHVPGFEPARLYSAELVERVTAALVASLEGKDEIDIEELVADVLDALTVREGAG